MRIAAPVERQFHVGAVSALAFDAADRYASVDDLRRDLAAAQVLRDRAMAIDLGDWVRDRLAAP